MTRVARSSDAVATSTVIDIDLGSALACQAIGLFNHNLGASATWTISGGSAPGSTSAYAGTARAVVQMSTSPDDLEWEESGYWEGTGDGWVRNTHPVIHVLTAQVSARYWRIQITDTGNADGYVQLGRVYIGPVMIPDYNDSYGRAQGFADYTEFERAASGAAFARLGRKAKTAEVAAEWLSLGEQRALRSIMRRDGADEDVLWVPDATDAAAQQEFGFLGRITDGLGAIAHPHPNAFAATIRLEERL